MRKKNCYGGFTRWLVLFLIVIITHSCTDNTQNSWYTYFDNTGTYSSPRMADLNKDGVLDIIMGAGGKEEQYSDTAIIAIDGKTGRKLWSLPGANQFVGSAVFIDINNDQVPEVFIGGRWALLMAINGADGKPIWSFFPERKKIDGSDGGWFNFTTPQLVPDQDNDGLEDLLIANGGDARLAATDTARPTGRILVIGSKNGNILANTEVPDGKETYMSVVCEKQENGDWKVLFGTGGESIGGHLYRTSLHDVMRGDISQAKILATSHTKGFIASPVLVDINKDGKSDVVVNAVDGRMLAIDGATDSILWQVEFPGTEAYTIPATGLFNKDSIPDFFANFAIGVFPTLNWSIRFMVDGKTGRVEYSDTIPAFQYASAVAADIDGNGFDEVIINQSALKRTQFSDVYYSRLLAFDFITGRKTPIADSLPATNLASTPWIGDLDGDGSYDIIYCAVKYHDVHFDLAKPLGLWVARYCSNIKIKNRVRWGAYQGSSYTGNY